MSDPAPPLRIAMWSGPRNLSTTMMRSFGARPDTACVDEPFYAPFLAATGLDHPLTDAILAAHEADPAAVDAWLGGGETGAPVQYQKHMTHHMLADFPCDFLRHARQCFLIRDPARVLSSYARKMETASLDAIGVPQQARLFDAAWNGPAPPIVIDSDALLADPEAMLRALCRALDIPWTPAMLSWPAGPRPEDGAWAPHWYDRVWASTGFGPPPGTLPDLPPALADLAGQARPVYDRLAQHALRPETS